MGFNDVCSVQGCERLVGRKGAKGMCGAHYKRWKAGGDLARPLQPRGRAAGLACSMDNCTKPVQARDLCATHYMRWRMHGDPTVVRMTWDTRQSKVSCIWDFIDKNGPIPSSPYRPVEGNCWIWTGYRDQLDYGWLSGVPAYRRVYELVVGPIGAGLTLDHLCRVHACVRPDHMEEVTRAENARREGLAKTHCIRGHPYTPENTYRSPSRGERRCRTCARERRLVGRKLPC